MVLRPVQQGQLKLGHALQHVGVVLALAHFPGHVGAHIQDAGIFRVLLVGDQQVQLGVFLNLHAQVVQALDGGVAGEEVLGPGAKGDDLQVLNADDGPGNGHKLRHLVRQLLGALHGDDAKGRHAVFGTEKKLSRLFHMQAFPFFSGICMENTGALGQGFPPPFSS